MTVEPTTAMTWAEFVVGLVDAVAWPVAAVIIASAIRSGLESRSEEER